MAAGNIRIETGAGINKGRLKTAAGAVQTAFAGKYFPNAENFNNRFSLKSEKIK